MAWSTRKKPRPLCQQCRLKPVKYLRCKFCSNRCSGIAKRKPRPLCAFCKKKPVHKVSRGDRFCSRQCAAWARGPEAAKHLRKGWQKAMETQRRNYFARMNAWLKLEIAPVLALLPADLQSAGRLALMKLAIEVNRKAYDRGYRCARNRVSRGQAA